MSDLSQTDGMLAEWGARLFYPMPRAKKGASDAVPKIVGSAARRALTANGVREYVKATTNRAPQALLKITPGKNRGMVQIAAHMRYIARQGKEEVGGPGKTLDVEDERGNIISGKEELKDVMEEWRTSGSRIPEVTERKEAFNIVLSMPEGTPAEHVLGAARAFAKEAFDGHSYIFALHTDTDKPHVHLMVRAARKDGVRLNPRKADLATWRARFAARLQDRGVSAAATWGAARNSKFASRQIWRVKHAEGKQRAPRPAEKGGAAVDSQAAAMQAWEHLAEVLAKSPKVSDNELAKDARRYMQTAFGARAAPSRSDGRGAELPVRPPVDQAQPDRGGRGGGGRGGADQGGLDR